MSLHILKILKELNENGAKLEVNKGSLKLKATKPIANDLISLLKKHKEELIDFIEKHQVKTSSTSLPKVTNLSGNFTGKIPLSFSQERLWFLDQLNGSVEYHVPFMLNLKGNLTPDAMEQSLRTIITRHEILRTVLLSEDGVPFQKVTDSDEWSMLQKETSIINSEKDVEEFTKLPFDLSKDFMLKACLFRVSKDHHILVCLFHHIASDAWSSGIFMNELSELYSSFSSNTPTSLSPLDIQYSDYAIWLRNHVEGTFLNEQINYWKKQLSNVNNLLLPTDFPRPAIQSKNGAGTSLEIDKTLSNDVLQLCQKEDVTLFILMLSTFKILMSRYSNQKDICIGSPIANRTQAELEGLLGFFTNTLAFRSNLEGNPTFKDFLKTVKQTTLEGYDHQLVPFEKIVDSVSNQRDLSMSPLFQVMLVINNTPEGNKDLKLENVDVSNYTINRESSKFDLTLLVFNTNGQLTIGIEYCTDLFKESTAEQILRNFKELLKSITENIELPIENLNILEPSEKITSLDAFNQNEKNYPGNQTVLDLFKKRVVQTPNKTALVFQNQQLTYLELDRKSDKIAHTLLTKGVKPNDKVGICIDRSEEMIIGILAILKTGSAYVAIDPEYPESRIDHMIQDSGIQLLLTSKECIEKVTNDNLEVVILSTELACETTTDQSLPNVSPEQLAYLIYTSGSTGKPKGVLMSHKALFNLIYFQKEAAISGDKVTQFTSISFDVSFQEIFFSLSQGKELHIISSKLKKDALALKNYIKENNINIIFLPTSFFNFFSSEGYFEELTSVKNIFVAGEQLKMTPELIHYLKNSDVTLHNHYGPSEAHVVTTHELSNRNNNIETTTPFIGFPVANNQIYILDTHQQLVPLGVPGELCIGGNQLANGYLNKPELTSEKFIANPFKDNEKIYRTGDLAKWSSDGNIIFLGRIDNQVKVRGYRIELGEIENALASLEEIVECSVLAKKDEQGNNRLVSYIVSVNDFNKEEIQNELKKLLPEYMVPSVWIPLSKMPLTQNGKIDKKALPEPDTSLLSSNRYTAPETPLEKQLATIWSTLLKIQQVGTNDNFFELGGHSLLATRLVSIIRKELKIEVAIKDIFKYSTIAQLAEHLSKQDAATILPTITKQEQRPKYIPLSFNQERLWFIDQLKGSKEYDMPLILELKGDVQSTILKKTLKLIISRHEILRTMLLSEEGNGYQKIVSEDQWELALQTITTNESLKEQIDTFTSTPFDLALDYKVKAKLFKVSEQNFVFACVFHHIVGDGWSKDIFFNEFTTIYKALSLNTEPKLPFLTLQYADYAIWQRQYLSGSILEKQLEYWHKKLHGVSNITLPLDFARPSIQSNSGNSIEHILASELSNSLNRVCKEEGVTLFMLLLSAFKVLLSRWSNQQDICVGTPIANRTQAELEGMIGFFVNTLALRSDLSKNLSFKKLLNSVKETTLEAYDHQLAPFERIVDRVLNERDLSTSPLFQVAFILQNTPNESDGLILNNIQASPYNTNHESAKFDLTLSSYEKDNHIYLGINYRTELFQKDTIQRLLNGYVQLLTNVVDNIEASIHDVSILTQNERELTLNTFNNFDKVFPENNTLHGYFSKLAKEIPNNLALVFENNELTYKKLDEKSNQFANFLTENFIIENEELINVVLERNEWFIISILGIMKTGAAYIPIDPSYPEERKTYIKENSKSKITIDSKLVNKFKKENSKFSKLPILINVSPSNLAYIIYTSGSTGNPKGVMIEHKNVLNTLLSQIDIFSVKSSDHCLQFASSSFDASVSEIFVSLLSGSKLYITDENRKTDISYLRKFISSHKISILTLPPALLQVLSIEDLKGVKTLITAGEAIPLELGKQFSKHFNYYNAYGPTETSICATIFKGVIEDRVTIGHPIHNTKIYITDDNLNPLPIGVIGELCIGGKGVGRGYLNNEDLTNQKFVQNPFDEMEKTKLYKSGDLARWLPDGTIEFLGRKDDQVKIRGYRIELGEVEHHISQIKGVKQAVVLAKKTNQGINQLICYMTTKNEFNESSIKEELQATLPSFMVPSTFVTIDEFPLTNNKKVDKKALLNIDVLKASTDSYHAPSNTTEEQLATIWQEVLALEKVGVHDNFFEIGGNSILAIRLVAKLQEFFKLEINDLFKYPTVNKLSKNISYSKDFFKNKIQHHITQLRKLENQKELNKPSEKLNQQALITEKINIEKQEYLSKIKDLNTLNLEKEIAYNNLLLLGSTGYLGINLLRSLLLQNSSQLTTIVRAENNTAAKERLSELYTFYFNEELPNTKNITVIAGDITKPLFGIDKAIYKQLTNSVDSIINAAANAKHYGSLESFQKINVYPIETMISFANEGVSKVIHHVSTLSISGFKNIDSADQSFLFTEKETNKNQNHTNFYTQSKLEGDTLLDKARQKGIKANIYRVGNLSFNSTNGSFQRNIEDNAFYNRMKSFLAIEAMPESQQNMEISCIDKVSEAILTVFNKKELFNRNFHIRNTYSLSNTEFVDFANKNGYSITLEKMSDFFENLLNQYSEKKELINRFLLHSSAFDADVSDVIPYQVCSNKTDYILDKLGFAWNEIDEQQIKQMLDYGEKINFWYQTHKDSKKLEEV
ncbi:amino acid adenylation domain-containing protein/thioester reductase domain-containing protein [Tenacibaculum sp. MAR_2009_124]|uniref:non-ribosomal peptide synthetase n=1 Tax=Tenacibaculum sp. MAR_2009_124 TaxID=1250059 RepID=UPI00089CECB3|nr:non-ribosomal peptide synthetase [Tenacibaculum sp. MAR_2009_124]SEC17985.1 amino acid adenylation domain-containing protein/thioester reductase domain-containing protein [Tenacibaculum sp. MAR_2009_124]